MALFTFDDEAHLAAGAKSTPLAAPKEHAHLPDIDERMEVDVPAAHTHVGTPPIAIASPIPRWLVQPNAEAKQPAHTDKLDFDAVMKKAQKNRKKKKKGSKAALAGTTVRGFETPAASGGEESDYSIATTPRFGPSWSTYPSVTSSPALRPTSAAGVIGNLRQQLEALNIGPRVDSPQKQCGCAPGQLRSGLSSNASVSNFSDSDRTEMESYEVDLNEDFVSPEVHSKPSTMVASSVARKMTADDFDTLTCLGKGSFGTVLLVKQRETGRLYAQKQFKKASITVRKKLIEQTKTERSILESVNRHPFIVNLYYAFQDHEKLYLILEYAQGGELFHHLAQERMFNEDTAAFYMGEMVLALDYLHRTVGIVYRDLKPENCLLDAEGHLLLTDFGLSKVAVDDQTCNSIAGTIDFMAPEVIQGLDYGMAVDWWSLGALGYDLLTGSPPFDGNNHAKIQQNILQKKLTMPYYLSQDAKDLLTRFLRKEPKKRLGYNMPKDMNTIRAHRFFRKLDWKKLQARELEPPIIPLITDPELAENFSDEFTSLALSTVVSRKSGYDELEDEYAALEKDPFGGFSYVASQSLLDEPVFGY
ncbi:kinase-like protein [Karstenula rhodostoma CBS 690.94]|uniref:Kinase-like protein n=1 Tax=Karstenula rhodostoma CBS 690.94 TaxID=1392251 RepID=A0A9P4PIQ2_9PLEO|nr:kinase-like protein [Karstenula rhodostoma CBS 690.94]